MSVDDKSVSLIGTGNYARAFAKMFNKHGFDIYCGSRNPGGRSFAFDSSLSKVVITSIPECISSSGIIVISIHPEMYEEMLCPLRDKLAGKILIDVSNSSRIIKAGQECNAEKMQRLIPEARVVKGFNTISAYQLEADLGAGSKEVFICGDDPAARKVIRELVREVGFTPTDMGFLDQARKVENMPLYLFRGWGKPVVWIFLVYLFWLIFCIVRIHVIDGMPWEHLPLHVMNKVVGCSAITVLSLCYLPGSIAAIVQVAYGSKYKRFPSWLDVWLRGRKQLGLFALGLGMLHTFMTLAHFNTAYFPYYHKSIGNVMVKVVNVTEDYPIGTSTMMTDLGEVILLMGVLALATMCVLGISSIPAVGALLGWREWKFLQSDLGYVCLVFSAAHGTSMRASSWTLSRAKHVFTTEVFFVLLLVYLTLLLKLILVIPCVDNYVWKIRRGWERGAKYDAEKGQRAQRNNQIVANNSIPHAEDKGQQNHAAVWTTNEEKQTLDIPATGDGSNTNHVNDVSEYHVKM